MRCEERDAEAFGLGGACAVIGLFFLQIPLNQASIERAENHAAGHQPRFVLAVGGVQNRDGGMEVHGLAGELAQLPHRVLVIARLAVDPAAALGDLVRTDDQCVAMGLLQGLRLQHGKAQGGIRGRFFRERGFVHARDGDFEAQSQASEQLLPVARAGREHESPRLDPSLCFDAAFTAMISSRVYVASAGDRRLRVRVGRRNATRDLAAEGAAAPARCARARRR